MDSHGAEDTLDGQKRTKKALISVSDKQGIVEFARDLAGLGWRLISTGGTARTLEQAGVPVQKVEDLTGFPEIMDGRVKTLHPKIHGGLLGRRGIDEAVMRDNGIEPIDLLAVNLYPFAATVANPDCSYEQAVENIDVGGPAMVRAAAKNHAAVAVLVDPTDYPPCSTNSPRIRGARVCRFVSALRPRPSPTRRNTMPWFPDIFRTGSERNAPVPKRRLSARI